MKVYVHHVAAPSFTYIAACASSRTDLGCLTVQQLLQVKTSCHQNSIKRDPFVAICERITSVNYKINWMRTCNLHMLDSCKRSNVLSQLKVTINVRIISQYKTVKISCLLGSQFTSDKCCINNLPKAWWTEYYNTHSLHVWRMYKYKYV